MKTNLPLIMASTSAARRQMMKNAGLTADFRPPAVDEDLIRQVHNDTDVKALAQILADAKAQSIIAPDNLVIGSDQTLGLRGKLMTKASTIAEAREQLRSLRGQTHYLHSAVSCTQDGNITFQHTETVAMTMRDFSNEFLEDYLERLGPTVLQTVGCYFYEAEGIQLFDKVKGDYYAILGLPLLPLLAFLRNAAMIST